MLVRGWEPSERLGGRKGMRFVRTLGVAVGVGAAVLACTEVSATVRSSGLPQCQVYAEQSASDASAPAEPYTGLSPRSVTIASLLRGQRVSLHIGDTLFGSVPHGTSVELSGRALVGDCSDTYGSHGQQLDSLTYTAVRAGTSTLSARRSDGSTAVTTVTVAKPLPVDHRLSACRAAFARAASRIVLDNPSFAPRRRLRIGQLLGVRAYWGTTYITAPIPGSLAILKPLCVGITATHEHALVVFRARRTGTTTVSSLGGMAPAAVVGLSAHVTVTKR